MRVLVTGASGWIGRAVVPELIAAGHEVTGLARSDASAAAVEAAGARVLRGDLTDLAVLRAGAEAADGVVHLAFVHDFTRFTEAVEIDAKAVAAFGDVLAGTGKPLVVTAGTPFVEGRASTEHDGLAPTGAPGDRGGNVALALGLAERGVRVSVLRLPRSVHGEGDHGFLAMLVAAARSAGVALHAGDGSQRWPAVHVADAARLYRVALERAEAGAVLHAVGDEGVPLREVAEVIGRRLGVPATGGDVSGLGFVGALMGVDQPSSAALTAESFDWRPTGPGLLADLEAGHYFA
ncbi:SDR family oxidoreductase [Actinosynnema pretiosum subsp. pretiosum]|uniref:SDR family oxidoreductase n=1 Tax=Actinosynnema pretiosum subsp. pretiosum TaxID=103721 RepID=A0AA45L5R3_9PSEU|nr:oxidoreductase [Actinosynnema pretiosum subsp. pretiosum]QUF03373.1 SDR family oxidoreductase [Actinosynnema pretiosum subsp. pretiosum]